MPSPTRLLALAALLISKEALSTPPVPANITAPMPDNSVIAQTAGQVDQKSGPASDTPPNADVPPTTVTALDGTLTNTTINDASASAGSNTRRRRDIGRFGKREDGFKEIFSPLPADQHDASIEGTAYLTYTVVPNIRKTVAEAYYPNTRDAATSFLGGVIATVSRTDESSRIVSVDDDDVRDDD
ncbi:hypothetical protein C8R44DRAFT_864592 [Mycena epipterygia]|nr:hypothetical protein C8R44DRAFT_864592 [Mycena epipterygia]